MEKRRTTRIVSFKSAFSGIFYNLRYETNFLIQFIIALLVIMAGIYFSLGLAKWVILILAMGAVLTAEAINTSIEKICDRFTEEKDPQVKIIKDSAAAAVLIISLAAALIGVVIFWPYLVDIIESI